MSIYDIKLVLLTLHLVGVVLGVGAATFIEVFLNKLLADKKMDDSEKGVMKVTYIVLRTGLVLSVLTGIGFIVLEYVQGRASLFNDPVFWAKNSIIVILVVNAVLLHLHIMKLRWGSALSFVSWWSAFLLGVFLTNGRQFGYVEIMLAYGLAVALGALVLEWIRSYAQRRYARSHPVPPPSTP